MDATNALVRVDHLTVDELMALPADSALLREIGRLLDDDDADYTAEFNNRI